VSQLKYWGTTVTNKNFIQEEIKRRMNSVKRVSVVKWFLATDPEVRVRFPVLPDFMRSSGSGTKSTRPREYN
jgi:hypothetical protein